MIIAQPNHTYGPSNPGIVFYSQQLGWLVDPYVLEFQLFDVSTEDKQLNPVQVYPSTAGERSLVNLSDAPVGQRIGQGRYAIVIPFASDMTPGIYEIRWFWKLLVGDAEQSAASPVEVIPAAGAVISAPMYCGVSDLRAEGITPAQSSNARLIAAIQKASRFIEQITGNYFDARYLDQRYDGHGGNTLLLMNPVIALDLIEFPYSSVSEPDPDSYLIANRHLQGMSSPDDRRNPRITIQFQDLDMLAGEVAFTRGRQNIRVRGVFGFTEADGTPFGRTPELLRKACILLAMRDAWKYTDARYEDAVSKGKIVAEHTRDQGYQLAAPDATRASAHAFTGDAEIDGLLNLFIRPPLLGAA